jgi:nucleoside-diphosphate-sugar epimerase
MAALVELERRTTEVGGLFLRLGQLYGPGTMFDREGTMTRQVRKGWLPLVGGGHAVWSMTHVHDAATAVVSALDKPAVGPLNIVDDDPVTVAELVTTLAELLGARAPRRVLAWLVRPMVGGWRVMFLNELRGADNARARLTLDWKPRYATWRDTMRAELA